MSQSRLIHEAIHQLTDRARREIEQGLLPSCQLALALDNQIVEMVTLGDAPAGDDTQYCLFSASKAVVSAAVWQLLGEGKLALGDRVADHIPEFGENGKGEVTVGQLLNFTAGFPHCTLMPPAWSTREGRLAAFAEWRLASPPGSRFDYHITSAHWVLAELLERCDEVDYRQSFHQRISEPLGLRTMRLGVPDAEQGAIARAKLVGEPATREEWMAKLGIPGIDVGEATDFALAAFGESWILEVGVPGGGAVANAADLAMFLQALLHNPGQLWDPQVLADATGTISADQLDILRMAPAHRTTGGLLVAGSDGHMAARGFGYTAGPRSFGHDGAGGQTAFADPDTGLSFVYLTNGIDRHLLRQWGRIRSIASKAAQCAEPIRPSGDEVRRAS